MLKANFMFKIINLSLRFIVFYFYFMMLFLSTVFKLIYYFKKINFVLTSLHKSCLYPVDAIMAVSLLFKIKKKSFCDIP